MAKRVYWRGEALDGSKVVYKTGELASVDIVRGFFEEVFAAEASGKKFSSDLDVFWPMAYSNKANAKRALEDLKFRRDEDYEVFFITNDEKPRGRPIEKIMMSVQCTEHLIARKVDPIFEIYRQCRMLVTEQRRSELTPTQFTVRIQRCQLKHLQDIDRNYDPGDFTILTSLFGPLLTLDEVMVWHGVYLEAKDRPDGSIGQRWSRYAQKELEVKPLPRKASVWLLGTEFPVRVNVWSGDLHVPFRRWHREKYGNGFLRNYLLDKKELVEEHGRDTVESIVNETSMLWSGKTHPEIPAETLKQIADRGGRIPSQKRLEFAR